MYRTFRTGIMACLLIFSSCGEIDRYPDVGVNPGTGQKPETEKPTDPEEENPNPENPDKPENPAPEGIIPFTTASVVDDGVVYVWDESVIPEIRMEVTKDEWNAFLKRFDEYDQNSDYFHCNFTYTKGSEVIKIEDGGFRMRGNTSRRRPDGNRGEEHVTDRTDWHHCHFALNFRKFHKDKDHTVKGVRKMNLKWFKDDPCYVRELYCYDLFRRYGIWTSAFDTYCRLWIHVEGDKEPAYFGVYEMIEPIDDEFLKRRVNQLENAKGNLWKCVYGVAGPADLRSTDDSKFNFDQDNGVNYTYEFKGDEEDFSTAKAQIQDFIAKLNGKNDESFYKWIQEVCDVEFLLKTYAVNVAVGMWDDHWNNENNYYLYFNSTDKLNYKVFLFPYDYDNTLGTSHNCGVQSDSGRQAPYNWGDSGILMERLMKFEDFRKIYKDALLELVDPANNLFDMNSSVARIKAWQSRISPFVSNDTGEDMKIEDRPGGWGNHGEYRLMNTGGDNFFRVKEEAIRAMK